MVRHGLALSEARAAAAEQLGPCRGAGLRRASGARPDSQLYACAYAPSAPAEPRRSAPRSRENRDARSRAGVGDAWARTATTSRSSSGAARCAGMASQGQHRAVVLALRARGDRASSATRGACAHCCSSTTCRASSIERARPRSSRRCATRRARSCSRRRARSSSRRGSFRGWMAARFHGCRRSHRGLRSGAAGRSAKGLPDASAPSAVRPWRTRLGSAR